MAEQDASFVITARDATKEAFQSATANLQGLGERANEVKELMKQLVAAFAVREIAMFIGHAIEARARLEDLSQIAGSTPAEFSKFEQPALRAGIGLDSVAMAAAKLSRSIGEAKAGNTEKEGFLRAMGVDPQTADDSVAALETVLRSMDGVKDKNAAGYASTQLLGRSYAELRPLMHEIVEAGTLVATATDEEILKAKNLTREYVDLKFKIEQKVRVMAEELLPTLKDVIGAFSDTADEAGNLRDQGEVLATMIKMVASLGLATADVFYALGHTIAQVAAAANAAAHGNFREAATIWNEANEDIARHTEETNKRIAKIWDDTAVHVKNLDIKPEGGGEDDEAAKNKLTKTLQDMLEFQKHYPELMAKEQALTQAIGAESKLRADLIAESAKRGAINQRELIEQLSANDQKRLADENVIIQREVELAHRKGDLLKQAELKAQIDRNEAAISANRQLTESRLATYDLMKDTEFQQRMAREVTQIQKENMTQNQILEQGRIERLNTIEISERMRLISAEQAAKQRELVELKHQAALGNATAQGILARRRFEEMDNKQKIQSIAGTLQEITASVATHNRTMFELNKIAATANAIINVAQGVTKALAEYPPPISFAMAALQLAAGLVQIQTIMSASFGGSTSPPSVGGGGATPTYQAPSVSTGGQGQAAQEPLTIVHFHGANKDEEDTVRRFMAAMNEAQRNGARFVAG